MRRLIAGLIVLAAIGIPVGDHFVRPLLGPTPQQAATLPFLQDGGARDSFVRGAESACVKAQTAASENRAVVTEAIARFCFCYARALADIINADEFQALTPVIAGQSNKIPPSFLEKVKASQTICTR
jgi:hypothetical protein